MSCQTSFSILRPTFSWVRKPMLTPNLDCVEAWNILKLVLKMWLSLDLKPYNFSEKFTTEGPNPRCLFDVGTIPMWRQSFWHTQLLVTAIYLVMVPGGSSDIVMAGGNTMPEINIDAKTNPKITTKKKMCTDGRRDIKTFWAAPCR